MIGTLRTVVLDAPDVRRLAAFYAALGGRRAARDRAEGTALERVSRYR